MTDEISPRRVCLPWGFLPSGQNVRAVCSCGYRTTPRADDTRALDALLSEHGHTAPVCRTCGTDYTGHSWDDLRHRCLEIVTDPATGEQFLACRDLPRACQDGAAQRQLHLDRAAQEALGIPLPRPTLRLLTGGAAQPTTPTAVDDPIARWQVLLRRAQTRPVDLHDQDRTTARAAAEAMAEALDLADRVPPAEVAGRVAEQLALARGARAAARYLPTLRPDELEHRTGTELGWTTAQHLLAQATDRTITLDPPDEPESDPLAPRHTALDVPPEPGPPTAFTPPASPVDLPTVSAPVPATRTSAPVLAAPAAGLAPADRERLARLAWATSKVASAAARSASPSLAGLTPGPAATARSPNRNGLEVLPS